MTSDEVQLREKAAARLAVLANASRVFSEAWSDPTTMFENIARHFAEVIKDLCSVRLLSTDGTRFDSPVGVWDVDPAIRELLRDNPAAGTNDGIGAEILKPGGRIVMSNIDPAVVAARIAPSPRRELVTKLGIHSVVMVPLRVRGQTLGILSACRRLAATKKAFDEDDIQLAEELADRAALVVGQWQTLQLVEAERLRLFNLLEEREIMLGDLRKAISVRDDFVSVASHELRTPLTALRLQHDSLRRSLEREAPPGTLDKSRVKLEKAARQVERLSTLVEGLLNVSRIAAGRFRLDVEEIDLVRLAREVVDRFEEEAARTKTSIAVVAPESIIGTWDRLRLDQVLTNLVANAIKYGRSNGITVTLTEADDDAIVAVRDEGIGIAAEDLGRIFGRFERAVPSDHYGGLGLGLYIAHEIVVAHGGTIDVTSEPGRHTTFTVRLRKNEVGALDTPVERRSSAS